ncbi:MAG: HDOD domain-containing protein [Gammaproteobacteria bacterium]|nr:HDOD domain-containing protein [Gammaproteobacteria bacterium]
MSDSPEHWLHQYAGDPLPILRASRQFFEAQQQNPSVNISRLWATASRDPGLCLNFLRLAGRSRKTRVISVQHAMRMLGMPRVLSLPQQLPLVEETLDRDIQQRVLIACARTMHTCRQSLDWTGLLYDCTIEDIATAGIMSCLSEYLVYCCDPDRARAIEAQGKNASTGTDEAARQILGFTMQELGLRASQVWSLPELVCESYRPVTQDCLKSRLPALARMLCLEVENGWYSEMARELTGRIASTLSKPHEYMTRRIHITAVYSSREITRVYPSITPPAVSLIRLPDSAHPKTNVVRLTANAVQSNLVKNCLTQIRTMENADIPKILSLSFRAMVKGMGLSRVCFAVRSKDPGVLVTKFIFTGDRDSRMKNQRLPFDENPLVRIIMEKQQAVWVNDSNAGKHLPLLSTRFQSCTDSRNFFLMSVFAGDKAVGLFYADRCDHQALDSNQYKYFKIICHETARAIARLPGERGEKNIVNG